MKERGGKSTCEGEKDDDDGDEEEREQEQQGMVELGEVSVSKVIEAKPL